MTAKQSNKLAKYNKVLGFLVEVMNSNKATILPAALPARVTALGNSTKNILDLANTQSSPTDGVLGDRGDTLENAMRATFVVAGPLLSYARASGLGQLESLVDITRRDFHAIRVGERMRLAQRIHDEAVPLVDVAGPFGLTTALLEAQQTKINLAFAAVATPVNVADDKKVATQDLTKAFDAADALLDEIDPMLAPLQESAPDLFDRYQIVKQVADRPGTRSNAPADQPPATTPPAPAQPVAPAAPAAPAPAAPAAPAA